MFQKLQPFVLKVFESIHFHTNDNGPNEKLKSLYNVAKAAWILKYGTKCFYLNTWTLSWWKHGTPSMCQLKTSSGTALKKNLPPLSPPDFKKKPGMFYLHTSTFWTQGWINQQYITPDSWAYWVTSNQDWWSYSCPPSKGCSTRIKGNYSPRCSVWCCEETKILPIQ